MRMRIVVIDTNTSSKALSAAAVSAVIEKGIVLPYNSGGGSIPLLADASIMEVFGSGRAGARPVKPRTGTLFGGLAISRAAMSSAISLRQASAAWLAPRPRPD